MQVYVWNGRLSGKWQTCVYITSSPFNTSLPGASTDYIPAGIDELFDDINDRLMTSPPMTREQEAELISNAWNECRLYYVALSRAVDNLSICTPTLTTRFTIFDQHLGKLDGH